MQNQIPWWVIVIFAIIFFLSGVAGVAIRGGSQKDDSIVGCGCGLLIGGIICVALMLLLNAIGLVHVK